MKPQIFLLVLTLIFNCVLTHSHPHHFVLVHGSCHGAWSWFKIIALLKSSGNNVTAVDLAASGIDLQPAASLRSISDYHRPLMEFMAALPAKERVVLVGHSLGGLAISQAMETFPNKISVAIFVTALMPGPSLNVSSLFKQSSNTTDSLLDSRYVYDNGPNKPPTQLIFGPMYLSSVMYKLSPLQDWALATTLVRPLRLFDVKEEAKAIKLTKEKYGRVKRVFIISEKDEVSKRDFQLWMIHQNPPTKVLEIFGSDHMVMMSKPFQLYTRLLTIAAMY